MIDDKRIYFGRTVKALGDGKVGGYLIAFTDEAHRDLHGEYFTAETDLMLSDYPIKGDRTLYHHGLDPVIGVKRIGKVTDVKVDDVGVWVEAQLEAADAYEQAIYQLVENGKLGWSSGALPQSVRVSPDGKIEKWCVIEASLTPTPAQPFLTRIQPLKALTGASLEEPQAKEVSVEVAPNGDVEIEIEATPKPDTLSNGGLITMTPDELNMMIREIVAQILKENGILPAEQPAVEAAMMEEAKANPEAAPDELMKALIRVGVKTANDVLNARRAAIKAEMDALRAAPATSSAKAAGGVNLTPATPDASGAGAPRISVSENLKYAHLSADDMALAWKMAVSARGVSPRGLVAHRATDFVTEEFYRHAVHKMAKALGKMSFRRTEDELFVKSTMPFKADELDATDITGQGLEWLGNVYDSSVWETARNNPVYRMMLDRGMMEKTVPQGQRSVIVPVEGSDPTVYGGIEGNSVDATGRPEMVYKVTPMTTSTVTVTPGTFRAATAYTFQLDEDGFVDMAAEANRKLRLALEEHIEKAMINGDTETAANTNINSITGVPTATGLSRDYYLEFNGFRKSPLVTSTGYSRSGGALAVDDYRRTWALLGSAIAPRKDQIFFLVDFDTAQATLDLLPVLTRDVAGQDATLFTGNFDALWGIPVYTSGFLALSNAAGKIDTAVPGNNTKGQILAVYAPYWASTFKRNITIEMQRDPASESYAFYASLRFSITRRSAAAAACTFNLTV